MQDPELAKTGPTIPNNATYINHDIQNEIVELVSKLVTEHIVEPSFLHKMEGTQDPTGCGNISIVLRFVDQSYTIRERFLTIATADAGDAKCLTGVLFFGISLA